MGVLKIDYNRKYCYQPCNAIFQRTHEGRLNIQATGKEDHLNLQYLKEFIEMSGGWDET